MGKKSNYQKIKLLTREEFLKWSGKSVLFLCGTYAILKTPDISAWIDNDKGNEGFLVEAKYYNRLENGIIQCELCPHECTVNNGKRGTCRVRENRNGKYYTLVYNNPCAIHIDPVEKKPLFHVHPGADVFSLATAGCNLSCLFCQNWQISQALPEEIKQKYNLTKKDIITKIKDLKVNLIAYTYSEPTVFYEYMLDIAKEAKEAGVINTSHSNGFINPKPLGELLDYLSALNVDLKGFTEEYYREVCGGRLKPVQSSLKQIKKRGVHLELTTLVVPTKNDDPKIIREMCRWIKNELGSDVPLHFSRFYPKFKLNNLPPTPVETLKNAREIALSEGLDFVYIGNLKPGHEAENTYCPKCKKCIIERRGYIVIQNEIIDGSCRFCKEKIPGMWG